MCMKLIRSVDAVLSGVSDVIQALTASHVGECRVEGRTMGMSDSLREIHIKSCLVRIVMYSQRHVC